MATTPPAIPDGLSREVLESNKHRCCICYQEQVILHHIDKDPENNVKDNLAVLCLHHHGLAHAQFALTRNYTKAVITDYKTAWEADVASGKPLPTTVVDPVATNVFRQYERQQAALRIVLATELLTNYRTVLRRYNDAGGKLAGGSIYTVDNMAKLCTIRWDGLSDLGHLQEYVELIAKTYAAIAEYNIDLSSPHAARLTAQNWAVWNLKVGTAMAMSLSPLLRSLEGPKFEQPKLDVYEDFQDARFLAEFPCETMKKVLK